MKSLDAIDLEILAALQEDGRIPNVSLAKRVGLSPTPCAERVKALETEGYIRGYSATVDAGRLGLGLLVFIEVAIERTSEKACEQFKDAIARIPEIQECHMVAGGFDYLLKVRVQDMQAYRDFVGRVLAKVPGIRETRSYPVMEEVKDVVGIDLRHLKPAADGE